MISVCCDYPGESVLHSNEVGESRAAIRTGVGGVGALSPRRLRHFHRAAKKVCPTEVAAG